MFDLDLAGVIFCIFLVILFLSVAVGLGIEHIRTVDERDPRPKATGKNPPDPRLEARKRMIRRAWE